MSNQQPPQGRPAPAGTPGRIPLRNWAAAVSALILIPGCYYGGIYIHDVQTIRKLQREARAKEVDEQQESKETLERRLGVQRFERKKALETTAVLLQHQRDDIAKKLSRVRERLADETEKAA